MYAGTENGRILMLDMRTNKIKSSFQGLKGPIAGLDVSPDGNIVAVGGPDANLHWCDLRAAKSYFKDPIGVTKGGEGICSVRFGYPGYHSTLNESKHSKHWSYLTAIGAVDGIVRMYRED